MKSLLGVILVGLFIFSHAVAWGSDWRFVGANEQLSFYYDAESITRSPEKTIRMWSKSVYTDKGRIDLIKRFGKIHEDADHAVELVELDCLKRMVRYLSATFYSKGSTLSSSKTGDFKLTDEWVFIEPDTFADPIYKILCK